jgi:hypothetical protein
MKCKQYEEQSCPTDTPRKNRLSNWLTAIRLYFIGIVGTRLCPPHFLSTKHICKSLGFDYLGSSDSSIMFHFETDKYLRLTLVFNKSCSRLSLYNADRPNSPHYYLKDLKVYNSTHLKTTLKIALFFILPIPVPKPIQYSKNRVNM